MCNMNETTVATRVTGWLLLAPAAVLTVLTLVIPTVRTVSTSFSSANFLSEGKSVGTDNYDAVFDRLRWGPSVWYSLSLVVVPILVAVVVAPLVAAAVNWAGGWARLTARIVLSLTLVVFSPVALAIAWQRMFRDDDPARLGDPDLAAGTLRSSVAMMTFGVVCAIGVMIFLPVFRAREQRRSVWPALFTTAGVAVLGLLAVGLQQFTVPFVMTGFGPSNSTATPVGLIYSSAFRENRAGVGAAAATMLLVLLAILGVAAVLVVILTRLRVGLQPRRRKGPAGKNPGAIVLAAVVLVAVLVAVVLNALPWFDALSGSTPDLPSGAQRRAWSPAFSGAVISVAVAYLAALGVSGLRPLGRHSEWLLMPFAPWLFVGVAPLAIEFFTSAREDGDINTSSALQPPILVSILSLMILAVLCRGQSERWRQQVAAGAPAGAAFFRTVVGPTLPLVGLLFVVAMFLNAQDLLWPLLVSTSPEHGTTALTMVLSQNVLGGQDFSVAAATPLLAVVLGAVALVVIQVFHLDRMVAATGRVDSQPTQRTVPDETISVSSPSL
jgi:ABC-type sugar transport system permease subunit